MHLEPKEALIHMIQRRHIGEIVLDIPFSSPATRLHLRLGLPHDGDEIFHPFTGDEWGSRNRHLEGIEPRGGLVHMW